MYCARVYKNFEDLDTVDVQDCDLSNCLNCKYFHAKGDVRYVPYKESLGLQRCIVKKPLGCLKVGDRVYYREFMFKSWRANVYRFEALNTCVATIWRVDKFYEYLQPEHKLQIETQAMSLDEFTNIR